MPPSEATQMEGNVRIVYIGGDLQPGNRPRARFRYRIVKSLSTGHLPVFGAQLRQGRYKCGWVRKEDNGCIMYHLNQGNMVKGEVLTTEPFYWKGEQCFWGSFHWYAIAKT